MRWLAAIIAVAITLGGCGRDDSKPAPEPPTSRAVSNAPGAAPEHFEPGSAADPALKLIVAVTPATKPDGPLPPGTSCVSAACHTRLATARYIHGPVAERACDACHLPDAGGHRYPMRRGAVQTCTTCHAVIGTQSHQHQAMEQGCAACHTPHVSQTKFLLKADNVERLCATCHRIELKKFAHDPFAKGECTLCHQPHQADNAMLLRGGTGAEHCFSCHGKVREAMASAKDVHAPAKRDCTACHSAHATDYAHVLKQPIETTCLSCHEKTAKHMKDSSVKHAAMTQDKSCANCHSGHLSQHPALLLARMDRVCMTCHDQPVKAADGRSIESMAPALASEFLHGPIRAGECSQCHNAHGSNEPRLLTGKFPRTFYTPFELDKYALCFRCHQPQLVTTEKTATLTNFRDGQTNLHYLHVNRDPKGRSCRSCHSMHGSNLPNHIAASVEFEGSAWEMKINYLKTAEGGSCSPGCHAPRAYSRAAATQPTTRGEP